MIVIDLTLYIPPNSRGNVHKGSESSSEWGLCCTRRLGVYRLPDSLLASTDQQELLSEVYVSAVATAAGYNVARPRVDRDGIDLEIQAGGGMRPRLEIQLKATFNLRLDNDGNCRVPLKVRNYNLLRENTLVPRVLVVYSMPREAMRWATIDSEGLTLRKCAYWVNLLGCPETANTDSVSIDVPTCNVFDVACLKGMMQRARDGVRI